MPFASAALSETIVGLVLWVVVFPGLVTGIIAYVIAQALGERRENQQARRRGR
jgi:phage shock protein PspC (stress-responsive transcriptional regulator)